MTPGRIVEPLDVVEHICSGLVPGAIYFAGGALGLQRREEAFHRRVVPHIAGPAHAASDFAPETRYGIERQPTGSRLSFQWIVRVICITVSVRQMEHGSPVSSTSEALACFEPEGN